MNFVYIIDNRNNQSIKVADALNEIGFKRIVIYKPSDTCDKANSKWNKTVEQEKINNSDALLHYEYNGCTCGIQIPFGSKRYVALGDKSCYNRLKRTYGEQIIGVEVDTDGANSNQEYLQVNTDNSVNRAVADILIHINEKEGDIN